jgi:hypothetical protein
MPLRPEILAGRGRTIKQRLAVHDRRDANRTLAVNRMAAEMGLTLATCRENCRV